MRYLENSNRRLKNCSLRSEKFLCALGECCLSVVKRCFSKLLAEK